MQHGGARSIRKVNKKVDLRPVAFETKLRKSTGDKQVRFEQKLIRFTARKNDGGTDLPFEGHEHFLGARVRRGKALGVVLSDVNLTPLGFKEDEKLKPRRSRLVWRAWLNLQSPEEGPNLPSGEGLGLEGTWLGSYHRKASTHHRGRPRQDRRDRDLVGDDSSQEILFLLSYPQLMVGLIDLSKVAVETHKQLCKDSILESLDL